MTQKQPDSVHLTERSGEAATGREDGGGVPAVPAAGPLRELGAYLANVLDEDQWARAEALLLKAAAGVRPVEASSYHNDTPEAKAARMAVGIEPGQRECCNEACGWSGYTERMLGSVGPLCPDCGEVTEPIAGVDSSRGGQP